MIVDWQGRLTLAPPPWVSCHQSLCWLWCRGRQECLRLSDWDVLLLDVIMNIAGHLLLTSEPLKTQRINVTFALKRMRRSPICLNASMFVQIICDPASPTEVCIRVFYESLQIAFPNNVLVSQFRGWSLQSARHPMEERGGSAELISI